MQKERNKGHDSSTNNRSNRNQPTHPEILDLDVLGTMLDEDLNHRLRTLEADLERVRNSCVDPRPWEEEIAYARREQQIRRVRRDAHIKYVHDTEVASARLEDSLPAGDFDNSAYVYAATGGRPKWN